MLHVEPFDRSPLCVSWRLLVPDASCPSSSGSFLRPMEEEKGSRVFGGTAITLAFNQTSFLDLQWRFPWD